MLHLCTPSLGFTMGPPTERDIHLQNLLHPIPGKFIFPSESLVREPPPCSLTGSLWIEILHHQNHWSVYSCMSAGVPKKEPSYKMGKNIRSPSTEPHADRRPTCNGVRPGSPRGSLTTLLSLPQCHAALSMIPSALAGVDQSPLASMYLSNPRQGIPFTTVTASHVNQGRVEYEWIYGRHFLVL
jgi:hypothetical protein